MSRKKLPPGEGKVKISISIASELNNDLESITHNKSKYIEDLIAKDIKKKNGK